MSTHHIQNLLPILLDKRRHWVAMAGMGDAACLQLSEHGP